MQVTATSATLDWNDDYALLAQNANELLQRRWDFAAVRRTLASESGFDAALHRELCELGWLGLCISTEHGGAGMPLSALPCVFEPIGKQLLAGPYFASTLASQLVSSAASAAQQRAWLPGLASGDELASVALYEPNGSYLLDQASLEAKPTPTGFALSGSKIGVLDVPVAQHVYVLARLRGEPAFFRVPSAALLRRAQRERLVDETRRSYRIDFAALELPADALLEGDAKRGLEHVQRVAWLLAVAEMAGGSEGVLQLTVEYLKTRLQFGKPIGSYQALKHPMAEIMCSLEEGRSHVYRAAAALSHQEQDAELALRMAKAQLGEAYSYATDRSIQFHGAIGFTYECNAQLFFRRAQWLNYSFGDAQHHRQQLAKLLWP